MASSAELLGTLDKTVNQTKQLTEIVDNKKNYDVKGEEALSAVDPNNSFNEKPVPYDAKYPYNNSKQTESGHVMEFDDTPGAERINIYHRTGTFKEIHPDGSQMEKIVNDNVKITQKDDYIYIMGNEHHSTQGHLKVYIKGNAKIQVDGDVEWEVKGNMSLKVDGHFLAMAESFNFVGPIDHVGDIQSTGNFLNQGSISSNGNVQAELDFVGHRNMQIDGNSNVDGNASVGGNSSIGGNESVGGNVDVGGSVTASDFNTK
jgi:hypothetical protein